MEIDHEEDSCGGRHRKNVHPWHCSKEGVGQRTWNEGCAPPTAKPDMQVFHLYGAGSRIGSCSQWSPIGPSMPGTPAHCLTLLGAHCTSKASRCSSLKVDLGTHSLHFDYMGANWHRAIQLASGITWRKPVSLPHLNKSHRMDLSEANRLWLSVMYDGWPVAAHRNTISSHQPAVDLQSPLVDESTAILDQSRPVGCMLSSAMFPTEALKGFFPRQAQPPGDGNRSAGWCAWN